MPSLLKRGRGRAVVQKSSELLQGLVTEVNLHIFFYMPRTYTMPHVWQDSANCLDYRSVGVRDYTLRQLMTHGPQKSL